MTEHGDGWRLSERIQGRWVTIGTVTTGASAERWLQGAPMPTIDQIIPAMPAKPDGIDATIDVDALGVSDPPTTLNAPAGWHQRIRAIEPYVRFGPSYSRNAWEHLTDMSRFAGWGDYHLALRHLENAEAHAQRAANRKDT